MFVGYMFGGSFKEDWRQNQKIITIMVELTPNCIRQPISEEALTNAVVQVTFGEIVDSR